MDRPLNERGKKDAVKMGQVLRKDWVNRNIQLISSPALRAQKTCMAIAKELDVRGESVITDDALYFGNGFSYIETLQNLPQSIDVCIVVGHNPTLEWVAGQLNPPYFGPVPTCAVLITAASFQDWSYAQFDQLKLIQKIIPKEL